MVDENDGLKLTENELKSMRRKDLVNIMNKYSLKHSGLKKDRLVNVILEYQNKKNNVISTLITNNPIEKHHRGMVRYSLPPLIIYQIIKLVWHNDLYYHLDPKTLKLKYRGLLKLALLSKEFFKLISSLFNRVSSVRGSNFSATNLQRALQNPYSVLKTITHLTLNLSDLIEIFKVYKFEPIEIGLIFNNLEKLVIYSKDIHNILFSEAKLIAKHIPQLKSLDIRGFTKFNTLLTAHSLFNNLTSLSYSLCESTIKKYLNLNSMNLPPLIEKLKLPNCVVDVQESPEYKKLKTLGMNISSYLICPLFGSSSGNIFNVTKLHLNIHTDNPIQLGLLEELTDIFSMETCKIRHLSLIIYKPQYAPPPDLSELINRNKSFTTIEIGWSFETIHYLAAKSPVINEIIYSTWPSEIILGTLKNQLEPGRLPTGYILTRSKYINENTNKCFSKKIYNVDDHTQEEINEIESSYPQYQFLSRPENYIHGWYTKINQ